MLIEELITKSGTIFINPPKTATTITTTLDKTQSQHVQRLEWSHGLICILTESIAKDEINPVFNYGVYDLGSGNYKIDYNYKIPNFVDRKF